MASRSGLVVIQDELGEPRLDGIEPPAIGAWGCPSVVAFISDSVGGGETRRSSPGGRREGRGRHAPSNQTSGTSARRRDVEVRALRAHNIRDHACHRENWIVPAARPDWNRRPSGHDHGGAVRDRTSISRRRRRSSSSRRRVGGRDEVAWSRSRSRRAGAVILVSRRG